MTSTPKNTTASKSGRPGGLAAFLERAKEQQREELVQPSVEPAYDNVHQLREPAVEALALEITREEPGREKILVEVETASSDTLRSDVASEPDELRSPTASVTAEAPGPTRPAKPAKPGKRAKRQTPPASLGMSSPKAGGTQRGTIENPRNRLRDGKDTRRKSFFLTIDLIEDLEVFCAKPRRQENTFVEDTLRKEIERLRAKG